MPESSEQNTLAYVDTVIVPVANPATAHHLIRLALALVHPEKGKVIALTVTLGDTEKKRRPSTKSRRSVTRLPKMDTRSSW